MIPPCRSDRRGVCRRCDRGGGIYWRGIAGEGVEEEEGRIEVWRL